MNKHLTSDEKLMAALTHGSVFLSLFGPIVPALVWVSHKHKSDYVRFQALQALGYQTFFYWFWLISVFGIVFFSFIAFMLIFLLLGDDPTVISYSPFLLQPLIFLGIFGVLGAYFLVGFAGALQCFVGNDFRYPFLGKWLGKQLNYGNDMVAGINESKEEDWVGGMCHAMAIMQLWGILLPLIVWFSQKGKSARLQFQALQSAAYQGLAYLAYLIGNVLNTLFFFAMLFFMIIGGTLGGERNTSDPFNFVFLGIFLIFFLVVFSLTFIVPLLQFAYILLALVASFRTIRGIDFRYPLLGRILERWLNLPKSPQEGC